MTPLCTDEEAKLVLTEVGQWISWHVPVKYLLR